MNFTEAIQSGFKRYTDFSGRARRSEYWYWVLFTTLASFALSIIDSAVFGSQHSNSYSGGPLEPIFSLATLIPNFAVSWRRLHDINRSAWWILIAFTIVGIPVLIYWYCQPGTPGENNFGAPAPTKP
jgi:uncharacterized membrane protein YhaH (DUF805 family)